MTGDISSGDTKDTWRCLETQRGEQRGPRERAARGRRSVSPALPPVAVSFGGARGQRQGQAGGGLKGQVRGKEGVPRVSPGGPFFPRAAAVQGQGGVEQEPRPLLCRQASSVRQEVILSATEMAVNEKQGVGGVLSRVHFHPCCAIAARPVGGGVSTRQDAGAAMPHQHAAQPKGTRHRIDSPGPV